MRLLELYTCHTKWTSRINAGWAKVLARLRGTISLEKGSVWSKLFGIGWTEYLVLWRGGLNQVQRCLPIWELC